MIKNIFVVFMILYSISFGQEMPNSILTGSLKNDTYFAFNELADSNSNYNIDISLKKKTPILAGLLSFVLPGAGEIYTENYIKAGIFAAIEVGAVILAVKYNSKGDDQTDFYEAYANEHWSAQQYVNWTLNHLTFLNPNLNPSDYNVFDDKGNIVWSELNRMEGDVGGYFSHRLAPYGDQQYYEMIGKYSQFVVGWDTFGDENTDYVYGDELPDQFHWYSKQRGKANDFYTVAKWAVIAVVSNHFISALDAAWSASRYNKKLRFDVSIEQQNIGFYKEYYPQINFSYNF